MNVLSKIWDEMLAARRQELTTNHTTAPMKIDPLQLARYYGFEADTADGLHYANGMYAPWDAVKKMAEDRELLKDENTILRARVAHLEAEREAMAKQEPAQAIRANPTDP